MIRTRRIQTAVFCIGSALMIGAQTLLDLTLWAQIVILAPAVAVLGLPHGALDLPMAEALWPLRGARDKVGFFAAYIGIAGVVGLLWWIAPAAALVAFLAYSALHFSGDWQVDGPLWRLAGGVSAVAAPAVFHTDAVAALFAALGPAGWADTIAQATAGFGIAGGAVAIFAALIRKPPSRVHATVELSAIWLGAAVLPPLLYFSAYFCLLHSLRHLTLTLDHLPDKQRAIRAAAGITVLTLIAAGVGVGLFAFASQIDPSTSVMRVIFIGLAALTVPHMLLVDRYSRDGHPANAASIRPGTA